MFTFAPYPLLLAAVAVFLTVQSPVTAEAKQGLIPKKTSERIASGINDILEPAILSGIGG